MIIMNNFNLEDLQYIHSMECKSLKKLWEKLDKKMWKSFTRKYTFNRKLKISKKKLLIAQWMYNNWEYMYNISKFFWVSKDYFTWKIIKNGKN